ncbi:MAG: hypothetical protein ABUK01_03470 [Leptospirales bacterium]
MRSYKKIALLIFSAMIGLGSLQAQSMLSEESRNSLGGGIGFSMIDGIPYFNLSFTPDLALGPFGFGADLTLRINTQDGTIRKSDWDEIRDIAKIIRYVRLGTKEEKAFGFLYTRVGNLSNSSLGHGILMYNFSNSPSLDDRGIGMEFDLDFEKVGIEGIYSDFIDASVTGARLYVRPLKFTPIGDLPIIGGLEFGGTFVADFSTDSTITNSTYNTGSPNNNKTTTSEFLAAYALDVGLPIIETDIFKLEVYYDWAKYLQYGSGQLIGVATQFALPGNIVKIQAKVERRWIKDQFVPSFFNTMYLINRYQPATSSSGAVIGRDELSSKLASGGTYGELGFSLFDAVQIIGGYQQTDTDPDGILHLEVIIPPKLIPKIELGAWYDRVGIQNGADLFALDEDSLLAAMIGYHPLPFMLIGLKYNWTFAPIGNDQYETQTQIEVVFNMSFEF